MIFFICRSVLPDCPVSAASGVLAPLSMMKKLLLFVALLGLALPLRAQDDKALAAAGAPVIVYYIPGVTGMTAGMPELRMLLDIPGVVGIKMSDWNIFLLRSVVLEYPEKVAAIRSEEYYVNMMRAWYFATALAKQYEAIIPYLEEKRMDTWTHNKTIQKAIESYRITPEQKVYLRTLRVKK